MIRIEENAIEIELDNSYFELFGGFSTRNVEPCLWGRSACAKSQTAQPR